MPHAPIARINANALRHNLNRVRACAPGRQVMAVVKANAYGHGLPALLPALDSADALAVARLGEALTLRQAGYTGRLVVLGGVADESALQEAAGHSLELVVHQHHQIEMLHRSRLPRPLTCWLKVDTGMHRLGLEPAEVPAAFARLAASDAVAGQPLLMTHLANADDRGDPRTGAQLAAFQPLARQLGGPVSIANSAGILGWPASHGDWLRPGLMLYGVSPFADDSAADHDLQPVMTLQTRLIAIKRVSRGEPIGYGGRWICPEDMMVGVAGIGYGDGYPRELPESARVLLHGKRAPVVGRVSMDMITLDLRDHADAAVGDAVVLWGEGLPVEEVARWAGTIPYTLLCGITSRVEMAIHDSRTSSG